MVKMYAHKNIEKNQNVSCQKSSHVNTIVYTDTLFIVPLHSSVGLYFNLSCFLSLFDINIPMFLFIQCRDFRGLITAYR